jgi:hypothetical protein
LQAAGVLPIFALAQVDVSTFATAVRPGEATRNGICSTGIDVNLWQHMRNTPKLSNDEAPQRI